MRTRTLFTVVGTQTTRADVHRTAVQPYSTYHVQLYAGRIQTSIFIRFLTCCDGHLRHRRRCPSVHCALLSRPSVTRLSAETSLSRDTLPGPSKVHGCWNFHRPVELATTSTTTADMTESARTGADTLPRTYQKRID